MEQKQKTGNAANRSVLSVTGRVTNTRTLHLMKAIVMTASTRFPPTTLSSVLIVVTEDDSQLD